MPKMTRGPLKDFSLPDYEGGSIVNLMASVIRSRGGRTPHPDLAGLPSRALKDVARVIYLVVDGLGIAQLDRFLKEGRGRAFFAAHPHRMITTVCPATTAAAITTFSTGASPAEHGILGWHLHLPDLGMVGTILPSVTRTGSPMAGKDFALDQYLAFPSHLATAKGRRQLISYGAIPKSRYNRAFPGWQSSASCTSLRGLGRQIAAFARGRGRGVAYAYWPEYDGLCHEKGCFSRKTVRHLEAIDRMLAGVCQQLAGTSTALLVTADHGLVDSLPEHRVNLRALPGFYECLSILPSGDARQVHCFVRPGRVKDFLRLVRSELAAACACVTGKELMELGAFGPGRPHPAFASRVGDYVLLAREGFVFTAPPAQAKADFNVGNHGGLSPEESCIPLYALSFLNPDCTESFFQGM